MLKLVPNHANLLLQIILWLNVRALIIFVLTHAFHLFYCISLYISLKGLLLFIGYFSASSFEVLRLYYGYSGNLTAKPSDLNVFLIISPLIQLPILILLILFDDGGKIYLLLTTCMLLGFTILEFFIGIYVWHTLCAKQIQFQKIKREIMLRNETRKNENCEVLFADD